MPISWCFSRGAILKVTPLGQRLESVTSCQSLLSALDKHNSVVDQWGIAQRACELHVWQKALKDSERLPTLCKRLAELSTSGISDLSHRIRTISWLENLKYDDIRGTLEKLCSQLKPGDFKGAQVMQLIPFLGMLRRQRVGSDLLHAEVLDEIAYQIGHKLNGFMLPTVMRTILKERLEEPALIAQLMHYVEGPEGPLKNAFCELLYVSLQLRWITNKEVAVQKANMYSYNFQDDCPISSFKTLASAGMNFKFMRQDLIAPVSRLLFAVWNQLTLDYVDMLLVRYPELFCFRDAPMMVLDKFSHGDLMALSLPALCSLTQLNRLGVSVPVHSLKPILSAIKERAGQFMHDGTIQHELHFSFVLRCLKNAFEEGESKVVQSLASCILNVIGPAIAWQELAPPTRAHLVSICGLISPHLLNTKTCSNLIMREVTLGSPKPHKLMKCAANLPAAAWSTPLTKLVTGFATDSLFGAKQSGQVLESAFSTSLLRLFANEQLSDEKLLQSTVDYMVASFPELINRGLHLQHLQFFADIPTSPIMFKQVVEHLRVNVLQLSPQQAPVFLGRIVFGLGWWDESIAESLTASWRGDLDSGEDAGFVQHVKLLALSFGFALPVSEKLLGQFFNSEFEERLDLSRTDDVFTLVSLTWCAAVHDRLSERLLTKLKSCDLQGRP